MKNRILGVFFCLLLIASSFPIVESKIDILSIESSFYDYEKQIEISPGQFIIKYANNLKNLMSFQLNHKNFQGMPNLTVGPSRSSFIQKLESKGLVRKKEKTARNKRVPRLQSQRSKGRLSPKRR